MTEDEQYESMKEGDCNLQMCAYCSIIGSKHDMDRHHPAGRSHGNLLNYVYLHRPCHRWVHDNPAKATELGLLVSGRNTSNKSENQ